MCKKLVPYVIYSSIRHCHDPEASEVALLVVHQILVTVLDEGLHNLGRHELPAVQEHEQQRRGLRAPT